MAEAKKFNINDEKKHNKKNKKKNKKDGKKKEDKKGKKEKKDDKTEGKSPHLSFNYLINRISTICQVCSSPSLRSLCSDLCS